MIQQLHVAITGMTCASCEKLITMECTDLPGVQVKQIDHVTGRAMLEIDTAQTTPEAVLAAITRAGYHGTIQA